jgi:ribonuclease D
MSFLTNIDKDAINDLPVQDFCGRIEVVETEEHAREAVRELEHVALLGFDTETRPSFRAGEVYKVALLQLASDDCAYLFRLNLIGGLPPEVAALLANPDITKAGVAIHDDVKGLQKLHPFEAAGFVDLAVEAKKRGVQTFGLRALAAIYLGTRLMKGAKLTNWEGRHLTPPQLSYAANDAHVGLLIYRKMHMRRPGR